MALWTKYKTLLGRYEVDTPLRLAHFFAQAHHESGLLPVSENLNYSAQGLANTWPGRYAVNPRAKNKQPNALAVSLHRKPEAIANNVYANRMGNGDETSGDGWKYRGRGLFQLTGKEMYVLLSFDTGVDYVTEPDKLLTEADSLMAALWYWKRKGLNALADRDDIEEITRRINGGRIGLQHRKELLAKYKKIFKV